MNSPFIIPILVGVIFAICNKEDFIKQRFSYLLPNQTLKFNLIHSFSVSILPIVGCAGITISIILSYEIDKKSCLMSFSLLSVFGIVFYIIAQEVTSYGCFVMARCFFGLCCGGVTYLTTTYLEDLYDPKFWNRLRHMLQCLFSFGVLVSGIIHIDWLYLDRWEISVILISACISIIVCLSCMVIGYPTKRHYYPDAVIPCLRYYRCDQRIEFIEAIEELKDIEREWKDFILKKMKGFSDFLFNKTTRRELVLSTVFIILQGCCGIHFHIFYSPEIVKIIGFNPVYKGIIVIYVFGVVGALILGIVAWKIKPKIMMIIGYSGMSCSLISFYVLRYFMKNTTVLLIIYAFYYLFCQSFPFMSDWNHYLDSIPTIYHKAATIYFNFIYWFMIAVTTFSYPLLFRVIKEDFIFSLAVISGISIPITAFVPLSRVVCNQLAPFPLQKFRDSELDVIQPDQI